MSLSPSDEQELVRLRHTGKERFNRNMKKLGEFFFDLFFSLSLSPLLTLSLFLPFQFRRETFFRFRLRCALLC